MDDATSAVDPTVEAAILAGLRTSGQGTTVVLVAYRKATIALADEVVFAEHGASSTGARTSSCWPVSPVTATWSTRTRKRPPSAAVSR